MSRTPLRSAGECVTYAFFPTLKSQMNTDNNFKVDAHGYLLDTPSRPSPFRQINAMSGLDDLPKGGGGERGNITHSCVSYFLFD